ncbi:MAG: hypothetical protein HW416_889 [Chloroflexi bacterium]|nr:hypothetical protein [Chloroflexota bacterium]
MRGPVVLLAAVVLAQTVACAPAGPGAPSAPAVGVDAPAVTRTLVAAVGNESPSVAGLGPVAVGFTIAFSYRPFNAFLELVDARGVAQPYLAEALPQLNTDSWQVLPDGRMQTRYRLKPNVAWHDGTALSAEDFAFAFRAVTTPGLGFVASNTPPINLIEEVNATDARTLVINWRSLFPGAGVLYQGGSLTGLPPFPRHILESGYRDGNPEAFASHPYWTTEFVGLGPYKLDRWERGAFVEGVAFDGHVLGRPKIDRLRIVFTEDANVSMANMRAGTIHLAIDSAFDFEQALQIKREWGSTGAGTMLKTAASFRSIVFQFRPEYLHQRATLDARVRKALAYSVNKEDVQEALYGGEGTTTDTIFDSSLDYFPAIDRVVQKYPFDARTSERLMAEAGFVRGADGIYVGPVEGRLVLDYRSGVGGEGDAERSILGSGWRRAGFDVTETPQSAAQSRDGETRGTFPSMYGQTTGLEESNQTASFSTAQIAGPQNRWSGRNRQGWSNPDYDRLVETFNGALEADRRLELRIQIAKLLSEEIPSVMMHFNLNPVVFVSALRGPVQTASSATAYTAWNMHEWELR